MIGYVKKLLSMHVVRYAMVGGVGIPIHDVALFGFLQLMGNALYPVALICAFEISTIINFVLNQTFTYHEQQSHLTPWGWVKRAVSAQVTSLSALLVSMGIALVCTYLLHLNPLVSSPIGIAGSFFYNYFISKRFVFRPTAPATESTTTSTVTPAQATEKDYVMN